LGAARRVEEDLTIRRIRVGEGPQLRAIRLRALADAPDAFGQTLAQASSLGADEYEARARVAAEGQERAFFVAETDRGGWVGMIAGHDQGTRVALLSMWVAPPHRRCGVGQRLVRTLLEWAESKSAREVYLFVTDGNDSARALYASMGFAPSGKVDAHPWKPMTNEVEMILVLRTSRQS
jgi:GNAT superfamily N-acetyltransferase